MQIFNTLTRKFEDFVPIEAPYVGIYSCGPTVYDNAHIGHMRTYVGVDTLRRVLLYLGYEPKLVMNITDVGHLVSDADSGEDKMEKGAKERGLSVWQISQTFTKQFFDSTELVNVKRPFVVAKATDHIPEQIELIKNLEEKGYTYRTSDGVYFDTSKDPEYGKLGKLEIEGLLEGARVEKNPEKRNITDFALWKFSPKHLKRQMEWESPWGKGFPGWHIECSAMSMKYLGEQFDIHTGGVDHIPVHHTNEIAQSEAATGKKPFAKYWVHFNFLLVDGQKMSKSLKNIYTVQDIVSKKIEPMALRYLFLTAHYRSEMNFTWKSLEGASQTLERLYEVTSTLPEGKDGAIEYEARFEEAIANDMDMPRAVAIMWELLRSNEPDEHKAASIFKMDKVFGLKLEDNARRSTDIPDAVMQMAQERQALRKAKKFHLADMIRIKLEKMGYVLKDSKHDTKVLRKS